MRKLAICVTITGLAVLACFDEPPTGPAGDRLEPTSPRAVLINVETAFNRRDINLLKAMLSPNFVFYFDLDDVGQLVPGKSYRIPASWTYTEFIKAVENMFKIAHSVSLTIDTTNVGSPGESATSYSAKDVPIDFLVMIDEHNGFRVSGYCDFAFERYETEGGKRYWRLTKWWDRTAQPGDAGITTYSFGFILALFR